MSANPSASEWRTTRGEKWLSQLTGMEAMLAPVDEPLIDALRLESARRIADVACGGGGTTLAVARRAAAGSTVHGFDISPALVELARGRTPPEARDRVAFELADVATTTPDEPFDRLVSRFGIMFFDEPQAAFANLTRWLAPSGRFAFAVWGPPAENRWFKVVRDVVAAVVEIPQADPDAPGPFRYAEADKLRALLDRAAFVDLEVREWRGLLPIGGGMAPAQAARFALAAFSSFGELVARSGDAALAEAQRALTATFSRHDTGGVVALDACVRMFTGSLR